VKLLAISHSCIADVNQELYVALARQGVDLELVVPALWSDEYAGLRPPAKLPAVKFPFHALPVIGPGKKMLHVYRSGLGRTLRRARPDVVLIDEEPFSLVLAQIATASMLRRIPWVCYTKQNIRKNYPPPFKWLEKMTYRKARTIIALSEEVRDVLRAKGYTGPAPLLAHACDLSLFRAEPNAELRAQLGLGAEPVLGYLGRFVPEKGLETLIGATAKLHREGRKFKVLMVGSGAHESTLREAVTREGLDSVFVWTGAVPHNKAGDYMRCLDVFVLPSLTTPRWKEQFGRVIIEAMACGVPVAGSDSGFIPYLIRDTEGGEIFRENDVADCARAIEALAFEETKRCEIGARGCAAVRARYTYDAIAAQLKEILEGALKTA
jgi:glycosyltransferase involved in cell wall biosynthesis